MLIQALCNYYDILEKAGKVTPKGYSKTKIHYLVHLTPEGEIAGIVDCRKQPPSGKGKPLPTEEIMPERTEKTCITANIAEHRPAYLFGLAYVNDALVMDKKAEKSHQALIKSSLKFLEGLDSPVINAYRNFLKKWDPEAETQNPHLSALGKNYGNSGYMFCLKERPDLLLHHDPVLKNKWDSREQKEEEITAQCAVTGKIAPTARVHGKIKGVVGGMTTGTVLVGFNNDAECSYGMEQAYNSNISEAAMKKYTEALNYLLSSPCHRVLMGDDLTVVFWSMDASEQNELMLRGFLFDAEGDAACKEQTELLQNNLMKETENGTLSSNSLTAIPSIDPDAEFYMAGLKPNSSRLALKFFCHRKFADILCNVARFQTDMQVSEQMQAVPMFRIERELIPPKSRDKLINPSLMAGMMESVLYHKDYPGMLLDTVVRRIKIDAADKNVQFNKVRAGILKACINRNYIKKEEERITMGLNEKNQNQAYLCGRLFAILEKLQQEALGNLNRTIKDSYFASAASTPAQIFPKLLHLAQHHLNKKNKRKFFRNYDILIAEVMDEIKDQFPQRLSVPEQGMFEIGYYQQYQSFFKKNNSVKEEEQ